MSPRSQWLLASSVLLSSCVFGHAPEERFVEVDGFAIHPTTVAVGESFEVTWKTAHSNRPGDIFKYGLYLAEPEEVEGLEDLLHDQDIPKFFSNGPYVKDPGKIDCTRTDTDTITCKPIGKLSMKGALTGEHTVSFAACVSYVLDDMDTCDSRKVSMLFP